MSDPVNLDDVAARFRLAGFAGQDADEARNEPWTGDPRVRAIVASWQDVAPLHDEVKRLREAAKAAQADLVYRIAFWTSPGSCTECDAAEAAIEVVRDPARYVVDDNARMQRVVMYGEDSLRRFDAKWPKP